MIVLFAIAGALGGFLILGVALFIWALGRAQHYDQDNWRH